MSEEKKLTDEEIVKALECCINECDCENCPYGNNDDCMANVEEILDLIHRLQNNYSNLKEKYVKMLDLNERTLTKQQAEIERLTEKLTTAKQELVNEQRYYENAYSKACQLETQNTELQKQVDELKSENTELYKEHTALIAGSILAKQDIVKDTTKEILTELDLFFNSTTFRKGYEFKKINEKLKEIAKRNGVEVE